jgi:acyl-CoA synthetase (NDP forming)
MRHVGWCQRPEGKPPRFEDVRGDEASAIIAEGLERGDEWLGAEEVARMLGCYGIEMPDWRLAPDPVGAASAAVELGGEVALKARGAEIVHKTELGAVRTGLAGADEVRGAAERMNESLAAADVSGDGFVVQSMVEGGVELLVGIVSDPAFGPVIACGAGGTRAELLRDVAVRICPLSAEEAREALRSLATYPLLTGFRGEPPVDVGALEELLLRVSAMADAHHEIVELDVNPVIARPDGVVAIDARIRIAASAPQRPWPSTWRPLGDT